MRAKTWHEDSVPLEGLWGALQAPETLSSFYLGARDGLALANPPCLAVLGHCSENHATSGRNLAPKRDRSNLGEVELQG